MNNCQLSIVNYQLSIVRWTFTGAGVLLVLLLVAGVEAHHIMGIPHYAYDEQYPQTPVLTYRVDAGRYEVRMTGYPGIPQPGERSTFHVYITRKEDGALFVGPVRMTAREDRLIGEDPVVYGPVEAELEERVYKFYPEFENEANYTVRIAFEADGEPWTIDLPTVVGEPGSPWAVLGWWGAGVVLFLVAIRAIRIKRRRLRVVSRSAAPVEV